MNGFFILLLHPKTGKKATPLDEATPTATKTMNHMAKNHQVFLDVRSRNLRSFCTVPIYLSYLHHKGDIWKAYWMIRLLKQCSKAVGSLDASPKQTGLLDSVTFDPGREAWPAHLHTLGLGRCSNWFHGRLRRWHVPLIIQNCSRDSVFLGFEAVFAHFTHSLTGESRFTAGWGNVFHRWWNWIPHLVKLHVLQ